MESTVSIIGGFATLLGIVYYFFTTRHKERMTMLQMGVDPTVFNTIGARNHLFLLTLGLVSIGLSVGITGGYFLEDIMISQHTQEIAVIRQYKPHYDPVYPVAYLISIFLFVGISLILSYLIGLKMQKAAKSNL